MLSFSRHSESQCLWLLGILALVKFLSHNCSYFLLTYPKAKKNKSIYPIVPANLSAPLFYREDKKTDQVKNDIWSWKIIELQYTIFFYKNYNLFYKTIKAIINPENQSNLKTNWGWGYANYDLFSRISIM